MWWLAVFWLVGAVVVALIAAARGRSTFGWFALALVFTPLLMGVLVLALGGALPPAGVPTPQTHVRCPDCRELVQRDARKCRHCGTALVPQ